ncbi:GNAT superfamily N-acetyltransferase [Actinoplanes octamycinicus]|uniref:GNAT superfamily N-acetyltransferase n=1 Tax=Actinoplanes octamycinicus TaxID=135948 RepID=A0A7W7GZG0_9ACTN|nr:GNAT family N-acetyltransferase [Actinoplanes octamycinicus]MBB4741156.1 GNAT superfamily N-acetyltransferase [Actinoplanes octamycinicus]
MSSADVAQVVEFSVRAWEPVFASFAKVLGTEIYQRVYPDWRESQARDVARTCTEHLATTWVADVAGAPVGFAVVIFDEERSAAEIEMLAVDPDHQRQGIAGTLMEFTFARMRERGVRLAGVGTGGDPGHEPARLAYEKAGFTPLPLVHYYKAL